MCDFIINVKCIKDYFEHFFQLLLSTLLVTGDDHSFLLFVWVFSKTYMYIVHDILEFLRKFSDFF